MRAVKATYRNGQLTLSEIPPQSGPVEVLVVFPDSDDPWERILHEKNAPPAFTKFAKKCMKEIAAGKAKPLKLEDL